MDASGIKQALGLFLTQLPDEIILEDHETIEDALSRLRVALQNMCTSTPAFWKLALVTRIKDLVRDNMASIIEGTVEGAMQVDPSWMTLAAPNDDVPDTNNPLDAILDDMLAKHPVAFLNLQRQLSDKVAADVRGIMDYLQKHVKSSADLHQLFRDSANTLVNTVDTTMPSARPIHQTQPRRDTQVFSLDNLGDDDEEWGDGRGEGASEFSMDAMISRMQPQHSSNVSSRADFIQHLERIPIDRIVDADSDLLRFCNALVPLFFHVDICDRVVAFYWKLVHATDDDIAIQCTMYVDLIATLLALPPSCLFLRKQSVERGGPGTQPRHHHHHPPDDHQRPLLSVSRLVYSFLKLLPNKWIYAPNEVRANAMLATCMFLCHSVDDVAVFSHGGGISSEAPKSSCVLPPSSLLAYLDAPSLWFMQWQLKSPVKQQWLRIMVQSGLLRHLVARLVFAHNRMDLWRKVHRSAAPPAAAVLSRRQSAKAATVNVPPQHPSTSHTYGVLHQRLLIQTVHMLVAVLPHSTTQQAFPVEVTNPYKESPTRQTNESRAACLEPDEATNNLMFNLSRESTSTTSTTPGSTPPQRHVSDTMTVSYDAVCLHAMLMCMLEGWTADLWDAQQPPASASAASGPHFTDALFSRIRNPITYVTLLNVLSTSVASFQRDPTTIPLAQGTSSFRFPYEASSENMFQSGHSKAQLMHFVTNVIPRQVNTTATTTTTPTTAAIHCRILANITHHWLPRVIRAAMSSPSQGICECVVVLLSEQWCSVDIVKAVAASVSQTPSPLLHVLRIPSFVPAMRAHVIGLPAADRELIVSDLCATALGLLHFHDLLVPQAPLLDAAWAPPPPRRSMLRICQLANVPAVAKGWLEHPTRLERWRQAFERIQDHPDGLEAVYGDLAQCPYDLRTEVHDWWHFRRLCATPYAAHTAFPPHKVFGPRCDDIQTYLMSVFCFDLSATTFDGAEAVCDKYMESWFPPCTCHRRPPTHSDYATTNDDGDGVDQSTTGCMLDPPSWMQHSVRQVLAGVGGAHEWKRSCSMDALPSVPGVPCNPDTNPVLQDTTAAAALTALHLSVQQVLERVAASTSSLDFYEHVVDAFWHTLDCLEDIWGVSTSGPTVEMTSWMGDILWAVVCSGTSRSSSRLNETNVRQKQPTADADDGSSVDRALSWANKWMKAYTRRIYHPFSSAEGCSSNSSSSTLLRTLFQAMGTAAADPFVWTCVMMFAARKVDAEVVTFFTTLRNHDDMAAYLWPQLQGHVHLNRPLTRVAAAVELILHADFPHIELALRRLDCPVLSLVLRWQQGCFWNVLNWGDIMGFVTLVCVHGVDSLVYLYVVVLHHIATHQLDAVATGAALLQLQITPRLSWSAYRPLFNRLRKAHYELVAEILAQPVRCNPPIMITTPTASQVRTSPTATKSEKYLGST